MMRGRITRDVRVDLALTVHRRRPRRRRAILVVRIRRALGNEGVAPFAVAGAGSFDGHWRGTLGVPVYEGRLTGSDIRYRGVEWGRAQWVGRPAERRRDRVHSLVLRKGGGRALGRRRDGPGGFGVDDALDVRVAPGRVARPRTWRSALEWDVEWGGSAQRPRRDHRAPQRARGPLRLTSPRRALRAASPTRRWPSRPRCRAIACRRGVRGAANRRGHDPLPGTRTDAGEYDGRLDGGRCRDGAWSRRRRGRTCAGGVVYRAPRQLKGTLDPPDAAGHAHFAAAVPRGMKAWAP